MEVVEKTWYKELEDPHTFYTNVTALKLLDHLTEFCLGLHTFDAVDIHQVMKTIFSDAEGIPYKTADTSCKNFIMKVVDETWYKELSGGVA